MAHYRRIGEVPPKRHTQHRDPDGAPLLRGADGGGGLLVRLLAALPPRRAVGDRRLRGLGAARPDPHPQPPAEAAPPQAARPRDRDRTRSTTGGWCSATTTCASRTSSPAPSTRRTTATRSATSACTSSPGPASSQTVFGVIDYRAGDYVIVPRATTHRWVPAEPSQLYAIEANSHIAPPKRYLSRYGQLLEHAPYCERDLHGPTEPLPPRGHRRRGAGQAPHQRRASSAPG